MIRERVYDSIAEHGPLTWNEIAERLSIDGQKAYYHLQRLIRDGRVVEYAQRYTGRRPKTAYELAGKLAARTTEPPQFIEDRVIVSCSNCGRPREVSASTARQIRAGYRSGQCLSCAKRGNLDTGARTRRVDWRPHAACSGVDTEIFFRRHREAKRICARCPVALRCLEFAIQTGEEYGVFGGRTPAERRRLRPQLEVAA